MYRIFLIEDDIELSNTLAESLGYYGYTVIQPSNFRTIVEQFSQVQPDLVLLDIQLPYYDGYHLCQLLRKKSNVPIIIISARNQETDQILALELGADDFVTKPFSIEMLHSKIKATIRRTYGDYSTSLASLCIGNFCLHAKTFTCTYHTRKIDLSKNEFSLLRILTEHHQEFVSREKLIEEVWGSVQYIDDNTLTVNMTRLKSLLQELDSAAVISSKRGVGYKLSLDPLGEAP